MAEWHANIEGNREDIFNSINNTDAPDFVKDFVKEATSYYASNTQLMFNSHGSLVENDEEGAINEITLFLKVTQYVKPTEENPSVKSAEASKEDKKKKKEEAKDVKKEEGNKKDETKKEEGKK